MDISQIGKWGATIVEPTKREQRQLKRDVIRFRDPLDYASIYARICVGDLAADDIRRGLSQIR